MTGGSDQSQQHGQSDRDRGLLKKAGSWVAGELPEDELPKSVPEQDPLSAAERADRVEEGKEPERIGVCCSGGGIRSAAFCLGAIQSLGRNKVMDEADYVSAVSGGSYIASSYATVASCSDEGTVGGDNPPVYSPGSPEEVHLRNHSTYMAPGAGGKARLALQVLIGMAFNFAIIGAVVYLFAFVFLALPGVALYDQLKGNDGGMLDEVPIGVLGVIAFLLALSLRYATPDFLIRMTNDKKRIRNELYSYRLIVGALLAAALLIVLPQLLLWTRDLNDLPLEGLYGWLGSDAGDKTIGAALLASGLGVIAGAARTALARRPTAFAMAAGAIAGPLLILSASLLFMNEAVRGGVSDEEIIIAASVFGGLAASWLIIDLTQWSLHPFYRRRLHSAFFVKRTRVSGDLAVEELEYQETLRLSDLKSDPFCLIVCAAANVSDQGAVPPGRAATPFTFTKEKIGGPLIESYTTEEAEAWSDRVSRDITLPAAVAMSGAAISPSMGKKTMRPITLLLGLLNIRLGVWMPNPRRKESVETSRFATVSRPFRFVARKLRLDRLTQRPRQWFNDTKVGRFVAAIRRRRPTPIYLFRELAGKNAIDDRFVYVSDGGHYDNLGLIELLRMGCTRIYCLDGGGDPMGTFRALGEAVALARSDLQVNIEIDPEPMIPDKDTRRAKTEHVTGKFRYMAKSDGSAPSPKEASEMFGRIVYTRLTVTDDAPWDVRAYAEKTRKFPYHSTADQLFDDQKFEAYRSLGAHCAEKAYRGLEEEIAKEKFNQDVAIGEPGQPDQSPNGAPNNPPVPPKDSQPKSGLTQRIPGRRKTKR